MVVWGSRWIFQNQGVFKSVGILPIDKKENLIIFWAEKLEVLPRHFFLNHRWPPKNRLRPFLLVHGDWFRGVLQEKGSYEIIPKNGRFLKCLVHNNHGVGFPTKNDQNLGCEMGKPTISGNT